MRVTGPLLKVLTYLVENAGSDVYGLELIRATGLKSGTLYPILDRLESQGWLTSHWETGDPSVKGRPRRRLYELTGSGAHEARMMLAEYSEIGAMRWA